MRYIIAFILMFSLSLGYSQSVAVVLSGGGAKGLYHIGILKALEENNIPIDYISGTSMGSIVGGLYAIGYSPQDMADLFLSEQIKYWMTGKIENRYNYYFKRMNPNRAMITLNLNFKAKDKKNIAVIPVSIIPSTQIDVSFNQIFSAASAASKGDFDNLFVPFRCVASDVYNKKQVVFSGGDIGSAIRSSMSIPFVFKPMKHDSVLLYDGGIYNNFPWQVVEKDFSPDFFIGGKCVADRKNPEDSNIADQIEAITMMNTDYDLPKGRSVLINHEMTDVGILDFNKAEYIIERGYQDAMSMMDSIKSQVPRRVSQEELDKRRLAYRSKVPDLIFDRYDISGLNSRQTRYAKGMLALESKDSTFDFERFKSNYFKLLSDGEFVPNYPYFVYNDTTGYFTVNLDLKTKPSFKVMLGGNISSVSLNQAYVGFEYKIIGKSAHSIRFDGNFSAQYTSMSGGWRSDFYLKKPFYYDVFLNYEGYNYTKGGYQRRFESNGYNKNLDRFISASIGFPTGRSSVLSLRVNAGRNHYDYFNTHQPISDKSSFSYVGTKLAAERYTENYVLFPTRGVSQSISAMFVSGEEEFEAGKRANRSWFGGRFTREEYFPVVKWFSFGYTADALISNHPDFSNPHMTNFTSPAFTPTPYAKTVYIADYRSNCFVGAGVHPTFEFNESFYLKNSGYIFVPRKAEISYMLSSSLVYQTRIGPASLTVANFDSGRGGWFVVFNFGYTIFNKKGLFY